MKTLIIVAHPNFEDSATQQFLQHNYPQEDVTWHRLTDQQIDVGHEQALLQAHTRIIFQFPLYWYSMPAILREWQDLVLTAGFAYGRGATLGAKEFGIVVSMGQPVAEYQAGGKEEYTISELLKPLQAMAHKLNWQYAKPLVISQFQYMTVHQRLQLVMQYHQYLTQVGTGFDAQQAWYCAQLQKRIKASDDSEVQAKLKLILAQIQANTDELTELHWTVDMIRDAEET
ncbi:putative NADPH-quinone reductase [Weissella beninensis]|uniref:NAD(P)H-dependent oxidoreductase n=1 Tax=Periweissella beninensis TaxID=504936 RepID=A0ABT0VI72_9LACO|nr:NAD(P)H-dependent oxidoreductase [Periweissella beninensis]MBM7543347.1 putative NADPH-quinone reductase [Periweissella beninensis]MCM2437356.1 NAD(P)H-dependent oxidoreductase [Periweissella beninensis]